MRIIITGSAGFIGFHLPQKFLQKKNNNIIGIDTINNYYSPKIKNFRLKILKGYKNFQFLKVNIIKKKKIEKIFKKFRPNVVLHIAGQPSVLYSFKNPNSYKLNNLHATKVISTLSKKYKVDKFIFASSSSVYGDQKNFPIQENFNKNPKNFYALTKLQCEHNIKKIFLKSKTKFLIFRFFTIYGPLGRPDMFIHKLLNSIKKGKKISLYNNGLNYRDFTYIDDVVKIFEKSIIKTPKRNILNICRSNPIKTTVLVELIEKIYGKTSNKKLTGEVKGEMFKTHGSNKLLKSSIKNINFTDIKHGLKKTILTFKKFGY